jgi:putative ABC transport system substrate-binding protein
MIQRLLLYVVVLPLVWSATVLGFSLSRAAEPAQRVVRVGFVSPYSPSTAPPAIKAFWIRLRELGYVEGQNLTIEARWADDRYDRLPALVANVLEHKVDVLVTSTTQATIAARNGTSTVPIVGVGMAEPLRTGLATSLAHPGGNLTGLSQGWDEGIGSKWLELLQETVPRLSTVAVIEDPETPIARGLAKELEANAPTRGMRLLVIEIHEAGALGRAFEQARRKAQAVLISLLPSSRHTESKSQHWPPSSGYPPCTICAISSMRVD